MTDTPATPLLGRRAVLGAAVGGGLGAALVLSGCSGSSAAEKTSGAVPAAPDLAPDVAVATTALEQIRATRTAVDATLRRFPALRADLLGVSAMHRAHEASLVDAVPSRARTSASPAPYVVPARRPVALQRLAQSERTLHDSLGGLALRAESGDFARLLAAMGAGISQRLAGWPA